MFFIYNLSFKFILLLLTAEFTASTGVHTAPRDFTVSNFDDLYIPNEPTCGSYTGPYQGFTITGNPQNTPQIVNGTVTQFCHGHSGSSGWFGRAVSPPNLLNANGFFQFERDCLWGFKGLDFEVSLRDECSLYSGVLLIFTLKAVAANNKTINSDIFTYHICNGDGVGPFHVEVDRYERLKLLELNAQLSAIDNGVLTVFNWTVFFVFSDMGPNHIELVIDLVGAKLFAIDKAKTMKYLLYIADN
ncbi:hypothetical protein RUND412_010848 [Rhizina undulata]